MRPALAIMGRWVHRRASPQVGCIQHFTVDEREAINGPSAGRGWGALRRGVAGRLPIIVCKHQNTIDSTYRAKGAKSVRARRL